MTKRWCFFVNAAARNGRAAAQLDSVLRKAPATVRNGAKIEVIGDGNLPGALAALPSTMWPVAAGGDGTVNLMVRSLRAANLGSRPFGVLPLGSGNAFAHSIGVGDVRTALAALEQGHVQSLDIMTSNHPTVAVALVSMSAGFESGLLGAMSAERTWRRWSRLVPGLLHHSHRTWDDVHLTTDEQSAVETGEPVYNVGLYNLPCYAFGKVMWPDTAHNDGLAEAVVFSTARAYWRALAKGVRMPLESGGVDPRWRRWRTACFTSPAAFQIDGEVVAGGEYDVRVETRAINVVTPPI